MTPEQKAYIEAHNVPVNDPSLAVWLQGEIWYWDGRCVVVVNQAGQSIQRGPHVQLPPEGVRIPA